MIDIIETIYRGASKGRGLVVSPKGTEVPSSNYSVVQFELASSDYSTRYRY